MHGGDCLNNYERIAMREKRTKNAQYRLIDENETTLLGLSRLDQSFPNRSESIR